MTNYHISPDNKRRICISPFNCKYGIKGEVSPMKGGSYYASSVQKGDISHIIRAWSDHVGEAEARQMLANREARDKTSDFHVTILDPKETRELRKSGVNPEEEDLSSVLVIPQGIGRQIDQDNNETWFITAHSAQADTIREKLGLGKKDFHITLGFKGKDVHGVPKDNSTDAGVFDENSDNSSIDAVEPVSDQALLELKAKRESLQYDTKVSLALLKPIEFETDAEGNVIIPEDLREKISQEIKDKYLSESVSEDGKYVMLKYSKSAMHDQHWNQVTVNFRGVLTDREHKRVYARGFTKFFNVSEHEQREGFEELPKDQEVVLAKKMDGSLGLITNVDGENRVYTSGSALVYENEIASEGRKILHEKLNDNGSSDWKPPKNITVLGEIISPVNRIVVDYKDQRRLVVLSAVDNRTGKTLPDDQVKEIADSAGLETVEKINGGKPMSYQRALGVPVESGEEGYVLEFQNDSQTRAKVKGEEYVRAHKVTTSMNTKALWESINEGSDEELLQTVKRNAPENAYQTLLMARNKIKSDADTRYLEREAKVKKAFKDYGVSSIDEISKEEMGKFVGHLRGYGSGKSDFGVDIMIAKGNTSSAKEAIMKHIKPSGNQSILSLVSSEKVEAGDNDDDLIGMDV